jgi:hypothetical protein
VQSFADYVDYDREEEDNDPMLEDGFSCLMDLLVQRLKGRVEIHLNASVTSINWSSNPVRLVTERWVLSTEHTEYRLSRAKKYKIYPHKK